MTPRQEEHDQEHESGGGYSSPPFQFVEQVGDRLARLEAVVVSLEKSTTDFIKHQRDNNQIIFRALDEFRDGIAKSGRPDWGQWGVFASIFFSIVAALWVPFSMTLTDQKARLERIEEQSIERVIAQAKTEERTAIIWELMQAQAAGRQQVVISPQPQGGTP